MIIEVSLDGRPTTIAANRTNAHAIVKDDGCILRLHFLNQVKNRVAKKGHLFYVAALGNEERKAPNGGWNHLPKP
jgi:hypothetical protein